MGTALLALCFCALSLILALFVGISPISDMAKIRFMYVGAALSLMAVPMMSHYIAGLNNIVDELRYQAVLVFIVVVCCYCFVMANMVKYNVMKNVFYISYVVLIFFYQYAHYLTIFLIVIPQSFSLTKFIRASALPLLPYPLWAI